MFINNLTGKPIKDISFEGFVFTIPAGVSLAWDKFGKFALNLYKVEGEGGGVPPIVEAKAAAWDGSRYVDVVRFELNAEYIPKRADLIKIGKQRGIDAETLEQWKEDEEIDNMEIARAINELDVPDHIKYPEVSGGSAAEDSTDLADDVLNDAGAKEAGTSDSTVIPPTPAAPAAAQTATAPVKQAAPTTKGSEKKGAAKKTAKPAARAPKTPKATK